MIFNTGVNSTSAEINSVITQLENEVNTLITGLNTEINTMLTTLNDTISNSVGAVKSVQNGLAVSSTSGVVNINIKPVNPKKCLVLVLPTEINGGSYVLFPTLYSLTETVLTVTESSRSYNGYTMQVSFSWQVIEFY